MTVGKAIYYLLNNSTDLEAVVGTRIFPEVAEQNSALPFVMYSVISNEPSDTHSGPSLLDVAQVDVIAYNTSYTGCVDMGVYVRAALDRVQGTYNGVNVQSCQYNSEVIDFDEYKRAYVITQSYDVRISRTEFEIAQGTPVTGALLGDLSDVTLTDPQDREALVYDQDTDTWVNGASTKLAIRVINQTGGTLYAGSPVKSSGVQGDQVSITIYRATQDPKLFIGLLSADIENGGTGYAQQTGTIYHLNTSAFDVGDILYPAESALALDNGLDYMTTTPPGSSSNAPAAKIPAAIVLRKHANTGRVYVRTWSPDSKLEELANVYAPSKNAGDALVWNGTQWTAGAVLSPAMYDLRDVFDYSVGTPSGGSILVWDAVNGYWFPQPKISFLPDTSVYYLGQYDTEAGTGRTAASTASITVERYLTIQGNGEGESISAQSDTPSSGNKIVRKIWHKANSFEQSDVDTWTLVHTFADDTAYSATEATFEALLNAQTYGTPPFTLAQSWEEVALTSYLLDTYDGADYAYDLRLLSSTYTGDAINVRRASDNAVQDIGFDGNGDLDTSALATFCAGTDGYIVRWYDQSGNGGDLVQSTTADQPQIVSSGSVILENGKPKIQGALGKSLRLPSGISGGVKIFSVGRIETDCVFIGSLSTSDFLLTGQSGSSSTTMAANATISSVRRNGSNYTLSTRGSFYTDFSAQHVMNVEASISFANNDRRLGYQNYGVLPMMSQQAIVIYPSTSTHAAADIESNINTYYSIY